MSAYAGLDVEAIFAEIVRRKRWARHARSCACPICASGRDAAKALLRHRQLASRRARKADAS